MKTRIIRCLYKKEMLDVLRDRKTVLMMLVIPLVLYPLLFIVGMQLMANISAGMAEQTYRIVFDFEDTDGTVTKMFEDVAEDGYSFEILDNDLPETALKEEQIDAYIEKTEEEGRIYFQVHYASTVTNSSYATDMIADVLNRYNEQLAEQNIREAGMNVDQILHPVDIKYVDISGSEETAGNLLGTVLPFMLVVSLLLGTMYPAIDTTAGERERGTLETILTLPVSNRELIISKFLTVATIGIISAILNIVAMSGVGIYMYRMVSSMTKASSGISLKRFIPAMIVGILCVLAFAVFISAVTMCVCAFAKSYKEANNYITPLTLVVMFASFVGFIPNVELTGNMALVPVANICLLLRDMLAFKIDIGIIAIVLVSNVAYGIIAIMLLGKIYNSESVLFGDGSNGVQIFERRSNMRQGGVPTMGDAWLVVAVTAVLIIYAGGSMQLKFGYGGVLGTQLILVGIPILTALYTRKDMRKTFSVRLCSLRYVLGGIFLIAGAIALGMLLTVLTGLIFTSSAENAAESMNSLLGDHFVMTLLVVALAPAICEELMFRGYIFSAFSAALRPWAAVLTVSVIFGLYHMSIVKFFTTALIGGVICYVVYRSQSIFPGMMMHFINNALSVVVMYYPEQTGRVLPVLVRESLSASDVLMIGLSGMVLLGIGVMIVEKKDGINRRKSS